MNINVDTEIPAHNANNLVTIPEGAENLRFFAIDYHLPPSAPHIYWGGHTVNMDQWKDMPDKIWYLRPLDFYDDCGEEIWIMRNSISWDGIIRADGFENAYEIWEDEFAPDGEEPEGDELEEGSHAQACWDEANGYRPNGPPSNEDKPHLKSGIYSKDLNGESLDRLTYRLLMSLTSWGVEIHYTMPAEEGECDIHVAERYENGSRMALNVSTK